MGHPADPKRVRRAWRDRVVPRVLIRDLDAKFTRSSTPCSRRTEPGSSPRRSERRTRTLRLGGTVRSDCLDWSLLLGRRHLERILREYIVHFNEHRPHRAMGLRAPAGEGDPLKAPGQCQGGIERRRILGGLINEYPVAA